MSPSQTAAFLRKISSQVFRDPDRDFAIKNLHRILSSIDKTRTASVRTASDGFGQGTVVGRVKSPCKISIDVLQHPNAARLIESRSCKQGYGLLNLM